MLLSQGKPHGIISQQLLSTIHYSLPNSTIILQCYSCSRFMQNFLSWSLVSHQHLILTRKRQLPTCSNRPETSIYARLRIFTAFCFYFAVLQGCYYQMQKRQSHRMQRNLNCTEQKEKHLGLTVLSALLLYCAISPTYKQPFLLRHRATSSNFSLIAAVLPAPCLQHAGSEHRSHKWLLLPAGRAWRAYTHTYHCHALFLMQQLIVAAGS